MKTIIRKIELEGEGLKHTDVGYTTSSSIVDSINEQYDITLGGFLAERRTKIQKGEVSINVFFTTTPFVYEARVEVDTINGLGLSKITDINDL
tara:strand:- start:6993 stop:7271 length:279 start_codon:yes stop_codon:yes gene_type:complete